MSHSSTLLHVLLMPLRQLVSYKPQTFTGGRQWLTAALLGLLLIPGAASATDASSQLVMVLGAEPDGGFDPIMGWGKYNHPLIQSTLLKRGRDSRMIGDLATSWQLSDNRRQWHVTLRSGVRFSDGSPLTSADVAFTFNTAKKAAGVQDLSNLQQVSVVSDTELVFTLAQPDLGFLDTLAELGIVPRHGYGPRYGQHPVGSGPFKLVRWDKGQQLVLEANPYYRSADAGQSLLKTPFFKRLVIVFADEDSRFALLRTGQLQLAALAPRYASGVEQLGQYRLWPLQSVDNRGIAWPMAPQRNEITAEPVVRQAFDLALDRQQLVQALLGGFASSAWSIADGLPWGGVAPDWAAMPMAERYVKAKQLLAQQGWQMAADGVRYKKGTALRFSLYYLAGDSIREQLALACAQMVRPLGFDVQVHGDSWENIYKVMHHSPVLFGFGSLSANELRLTHLGAQGGKGYFNSGYYANPLVDKALAQAREAVSVADAKPYWQQAQMLIAQDRPWSWLVNLQHLYATAPCLDLGKPLIEPHGHGWPITNNISEWRWQCR
ncbi:ABC transporter substrate-binding protein [Shewanella sp. YIC-542]|uniref:ABC transporter substrate-binding protein n=1 Tax=Shewanella mytili TaxID=3377111 RepID=UPI00398E98DE